MSRVSRRQGTKSTRRNARTVAREKRFARMMGRIRDLQLSGLPYRPSTESQFRKALRRGLI